MHRLMANTLINEETNCSKSSIEIMSSRSGTLLVNEHGETALLTKCVRKGTPNTPLDKKYAMKSEIGTNYPKFDAAQYVSANCNSKDLSKTNNPNRNLLQTKHSILEKSDEDLIDEILPLP